MRSGRASVAYTVLFAYTTVWTSSSTGGANVRAFEWPRRVRFAGEGGGGVKKPADYNHAIPQDVYRRMTHCKHTRVSCTNNFNLLYDNIVTLIAVLQYVVCWC